MRDDFLDFDGGWLWARVTDRDPRVLALYRRHYSARRNQNKPRQKRSNALNRGGVAGTGDYIALLGIGGNALFIWKRYPGGLSRDGKQSGVVCSVFRNEGPELSSSMILEAELWARARWGRERLYTYVWGEAIRSVNPGYCFKMAGWRKCGRSLSGLTILEKT